MGGKTVGESRSANGPVLRFEREDAGEEELKHGCDAQGYQQNGNSAVTAQVQRMVKIDKRSEKCQQDQAEQHPVIHRDKLRVLRITLLFHVRPSLGQFW